MTRSAFLVAAIVIVLGASLLPSLPRVRAADTLYAVSGVVVSDAGSPLAGVSVNGYTSAPDGMKGSSDNAITAEDGSFTLHLAEGKGSLNAYYEKWRRSAYQDVAVGAADITGVRLVIQTPPPKTAIVEGTVTAGGAPVGGALVHIGQGCCYMYAGDGGGSATPPPPTKAPNASDGTASSSSGSATIARPIYYDGDDQEMTTGADGKFHFATYAGPRQLTVTAKGYAQSTLSVDAKDNETVTADIKMMKVPASDAVVHGRVVDASTGAPLAGAGVSLGNLEWSRYAYNTTGADGAFTFTTVPGWSVLNVYYYGAPIAIAVDAAAAPGTAVKAMPPAQPTKQYYAFVMSVRIVSGDNALDVKLEPKPDAAIALVGYVVDPDAKTGVSNATVSVWNQDTGDWGSATTDATGSYKLLVRAGHYTANAWAPGHLQGAVAFTILDGAATKRVDIEAPAGETRYAPCDDRCPTPMPMEKGIAGGPATSNAASPSPSGGSTATPTTSAASPPAGADSSRAAAYAGTGGGLPPYDASKASDSIPAAQRTSPVPFAGAATALLALAGAAVVIAFATQRKPKQ